LKPSSYIRLTQLFFCCVALRWASHSSSLAALMVSPALLRDGTSPSVRVMVDTVNNARRTGLAVYLGSVAATAVVFQLIWPWACFR
jgi:hypothetical protein